MMRINSKHQERTLKNNILKMTNKDTIGIRLPNSDIFITKLYHSII